MQPLRIFYSSPACIESLEQRQLLTWGPYAQLIDQDKAVANFPQITGKGVNIAVIDSGIDFGHPQLQGVVWQSSGEIAGNDIDDDHNGFIDDINGWDFYRNDDHPDDENSHGTQMAGLIAGRKYTALDGYEYQGIAPEAKIIPLKFSDPYAKEGDIRADQKIERALRWVENNYQRYNIRIVNLSVKVEKADFLATFVDEVARLKADGIFIIASAGHYGRSDQLIWPAADPNVFSAGMVDAHDQIPEDEQRGPELDILAPGSKVPILHKGSAYLISGTASSYPPPFIAGTAALLLQINPNFTPDQIMDILRTSGTPIHDPGGLTYPRLDVDGAIRLAMKRSGQDPGPDPDPDPGATQKPFKKKAFNSGQRIEAEDFDIGGEGVSFHDTTRKNIKRNPYRRGPVALKATSDSQGKYDVTGTRAGEWLEYTINIGQTGLYKLEARVSAQAAGAAFHVEIDGSDRTGSISVPATGKGERWKTVTKSNLSLSAGQHVMRIYFDRESTAKSAGNFNWFRLSKNRF